MIQVGDQVRWLDHLIKNKRVYLHGRVMRIVDHGAYLTGQINYHNQEVPLDQLEVIKNETRS